MLIGQEFRLEDWGWDVKVFYIIDSIPINYVIDELQVMGLSNELIYNSLLEFRNGSINSGLTFSDVASHKSIIIVGATSTPEEFQSTFDHEKFHLTMHIVKQLNIDPFSEDAAYLTGEIGLQMFAVAKRFLCEHCRENIT